MNRRKLLKGGVTIIIGTALLLHGLHGKSKSMASKKEDFEITKTEEEWRQILTPEQFFVLRKHGTEWAGTSPLNKNYEAGTYRCAGCGLPVFTSETKFNSGTGWPSFYAPLAGADQHLG